jgi:hypothetical protein
MRIGPIISPRRLKNPQVLKVFCWAGAIFFVSILILFSLSFGGIGSALILGAQLRSGLVDIDLGPTAFLKNGLPLGVLVIQICFYKLFLEKHRDNRWSWVMILLIVLLGEIVVMLVLAGRGYMVNLLVSVYLMQMFYFNKINLRVTTIITVFIIIFVIYGKQLFAAIPFLFSHSATDYWYVFDSLGERRFANLLFFDSIFKETAPSFLALETALDLAGTVVPYTYFRDFAWCFIRIVPQKLFLQIVMCILSRFTTTILGIRRSPRRTFEK